MLLRKYPYTHKCLTYAKLQRESEVSKLRKDLEECNIQVNQSDMIEKLDDRYEPYVLLHQCYSA